MGFIEKHVYIEVFAVASFHHIYYNINLFFQEKSLIDTRKLRELSVEKYFIYFIYFTRKVLHYPHRCKYIHILDLKLIDI